MTASSSRFAFSTVSKMLCCALLGGVLLIGGCTSKYGTQTTQVNHYPECYSPINELRQNEYVVQKSVAGGAVAGAALGAVVGYLTTGKASGALVGAAAGGIAGGTAGGLYGQHQKEQNDSARLAQYNSQLDGGIREVDKATAAAKVARQCYERQFSTAVSEYKAGHITREQFSSRYQEVSSGLEEAANILGQANQNSRAIAGEYNKALNAEAERLNVSPSAVRSSTPVGNTEEGRQLSRMAENTSKMERSVSAGQEEERLLRQRLAETRKQAQDLLS
ncbi:hypothetical protein LJC59_06405 [Desulfovibrio sp. OttesenSCG-928-A18]|nr:hypothetical protein [Desulfovibrio sp. OttesenSCG-928-A18]